MLRSSRHEVSSLMTTPRINRSSFESVGASHDARDIPPLVGPSSMRVIAADRHRLDHRRHVCGGTGQHRRGRRRRRRGERDRPAGRGRACVRARHRLVCDQRRPRRLSYRRAACGCLSPGDPAAHGSAVHQRPGGSARRAGRHGEHHTAHDGDLPANPHGDRACLPGTGGGEELGLPGRAARNPQERSGIAGRVALRAGPAGRGNRYQRFPE